MPAPISLSTSRAIASSLCRNAGLCRSIIVRALRDTLVDDCLTLAAALSFYSFLALFPTLLFLVALASFFPSDMLARLIAALGDVMPPSLTTLVWDQLQKVTSR